MSGGNESELSSSASHSTLSVLQLMGFVYEVRGIMSNYTRCYVAGVIFLFLFISFCSGGKR